MTDTNLSNPQDLVDAALSSSPVPKAPEPVVPPLAPVTPVAPVALVEPIPPLTPPLPTATPTPSSTPMGDETPLAFMTSTTTTTSSVPNTPPTAGPSPVPPSPLPLEPKKKSNKMVMGILGIFLLIAGIVGGVFAYARLTGQPAQIAKITGGVCTPGTSDTRGCTAGSCRGNQNRTCNSTGTAWGSWSSCEIGSCNPGSGGGTSGGTCNSGITEPCRVEGCSGKVTCNSDGKTWSSCKKDNPNCGIVDLPACKSCNGFKCQTTAGLVDGTSCQSSKNTCVNNIDCGSATENGGGSQGGGNDGSDCKLGTLPVSKDAKCDSGTDCHCQGGDLCTDKICQPDQKISCGNQGRAWCKNIQKTGGYTCCVKGYECGGTDNQTGCVPVKTSSPSNPPTPDEALLACTGITKNVVAPVIGGKVTFTCSGTVTPATAGTLSYKFRYSINSGAVLPLTNKTATTAELTIAACGSYSVQCQACATLGGVLKCNPTWTGATQ